MRSLFCISSPPFAIGGCPDVDVIFIFHLVMIRSCGGQGKHVPFGHRALAWEPYHQIQFLVERYRQHAPGHNGWSKAVPQGRRARSQDYAGLPSHAAENTTRGFITEVPRKDPRRFLRRVVAMF